MYVDRYSEEITKKLKKLKKKDFNHYKIVLKKIGWILENSKHKYKELRHDMKGLNRVHINPFVLIFKIDDINKIIFFSDYDHHDVIYKKK